MSRILLTLFLLTPVVPTHADVGKPAAEITATKRVAFAAGGSIRVEDSYGDLTIEGWDQPEVEVIAIKSMPYDYKRKHPEEAARHLDAVRIDAELKSDRELVISTTRPNRDSVNVEYRIHIPRNSNLVIHQGKGSVFVNDVSGSIEATCRRGDIMLALRDSEKYSIDAKTKFGVVTSDLEGDPFLRRYRLGERYLTPSEPTAHRIHLQVGFGGIAIKALPPEAWGGH
jgi:hypothetical protein